MPYTLAHPAFALPLRRLGLPVGALVAGSMTPDLPLWAEAIGVDAPLRAIGVDYAFTHAPLGVVVVGLVVGAPLALLWSRVLREPWRDALPEPLRRRAHRSHPATPTLRDAAALAVAAVLGAATHALLDEFTHEGRWAHRHLPWFAEPHLGLAGVKWAQYLGGVGGLAAIAVLLVLSLRRAAPNAPEAAESTPLGRVAVRAGAALGALLGAGDVALERIGSGAAAAIFAAATRGVLWTAAGMLVGALVWWVAARAGTGSRRERARSA